MQRRCMDAEPGSGSGSESDSESDRVSVRVTVTVGLAAAILMMLGRSKVSRLTVCVANVPLAAPRAPWTYAFTWYGDCGMG